MRTLDEIAQRAPYSATSSLTPARTLPIGGGWRHSDFDDHGETIETAELSVRDPEQADVPDQHEAARSRGALVRCAPEHARLVLDGAQGRAQALSVAEGERWHVAPEAGQRLALDEAWYEPKERQALSTPPPSPERMVVWLLFVIIVIVLLVFLFSLFDVTID